MKFINSIFKSIFNLTLTGKILLLFKSIYSYISDYNSVADVFYSDGFKQMIRKYLNMDVEKDWIGRLYGVINPNIDIDGNFNINNVIIEIDGDLTNNNEYVKSWLHKQLYLMQSLFNLNNFYNYISMDIQHVGPSIGDNYLVIFDIASRKLVSKYFWLVMIQSIVYGIIGLGIYYFFI